AVWCGFALVLGLMVGSFLNVLVARLPYEKSILWPGSRCFSCLRPIRPLDNLPIVGYLRLRGRCRSCGAAFSARYLWVEVGTGLAFLGLFLLDVVFNVHGLPGAEYQPVGGNTAPPAVGLAVFGYHAVLVACLIAAAVIDAGHRIIPPLIPFFGAFVGVAGGALMPWPWPHPPEAAGAIPAGFPWLLPEFAGKVPVGAQPWPFWGPLFAALPAGSWKLGLVNALLGALAGSLVVRWVKWLFEVGFGREALGLGDADLLMMAGAFIGWQPAVLSLFVGAFAALLVFKLPSVLIGLVRPQPADRELPFGPGLAVGVVLTWLAWPWVGPRVQGVFFDVPTLGVVVGVLSVGMLAAGLLLRRGDEAETPAPEPATRS
ncbi:MAG: prepilin peptidase, partial [Gemmataceae bacterium]|nr:prepilin peptidase [Gemmataceae bacterium]